MAVDTRKEDRFCRRSIGHRRRPGTTAVELAICLPVMLLLAVASADFGRIAHVHQVVCNAARSGAERGAAQKFTTYTRSNWESGVYAAVLGEMQNVSGFSEGDLEYNLATTIDSDNLARISVTVSYPFRTVVTWPGLPSVVVLRKSVAFRQFR